MKTKFGIAAIALGLTLSAAADFRTIEEAYELTLSYIRLPQSETGTLGFKRCKTCPMKTKRVTAETEWVFNDRRVSLAELRLEVARLSDRLVGATVVHHLENDTITRVLVSYP